MVDLIERKYLSSGSHLRPLDFGRITQYMTLDVITKIAYGEAFGYLAQDEDVHQYIQTTEELVPSLTLYAAVPVVARFFNTSWMRVLVGPSKKDKKGIGKLMGLVAVIPNYPLSRFGLRQLTMYPTVSPSKS